MSFHPPRKPNQNGGVDSQWRDAPTEGQWKTRIARNAVRCFAASPAAELTPKIREEDDERTAMQGNETGKMAHAATNAV